MTSEQQIKAALAIIDPAAGKREQCREFIKRGLREIAAVDVVTYLNRGAFASKKAKSQARALRRTLARAQAGYNALPEPFRVTGFDLQEQLDVCDVVLTLPSPPRELETVKRRLAACWAQDLLEDYDRKASVTQGGHWPRLAAILCDDNDATNFVPYCQDIRRDRSRAVDLLATLPVLVSIGEPTLAPVDGIVGTIVHRVKSKNSGSK